MSTRARLFLLSASSCLLLLALPACQSLGFGKDDFQVRDGQLYRGSDTFTLMAFHSPDIASPGAEVANFVPAMVRAAEVGGNAVVMDLGGFNDSGTKIDPQAVTDIAAFATRAKDTRMGVIVRVLGNSAAPDFRENAVRTAAKAFKEVGMAVYLIDGPDAAGLAATFKKKAPGRVVIAPSNGDLTLTAERPADAANPLAVLDNVLPDFALGEDQSFILSGDAENYTALDQALMRDIEKNPPVLDASILSEAERNEGFVPLFDGKTLAGWWSKDPEIQSFHVNDCGNVEWREKGAGGIKTARRYDNFVLRGEYKILGGGNSGVWVHAPRGSRESKIGMEFQIMGDNDADPPEKDNTGAVYDVIPPLAMPANPYGKWNTFELRWEWPHYQAWINSTLVQDVNFEEHEELKYRLRTGFIALTDHGNYVAYRNLRLKELD